MARVERALDQLGLTADVAWGHIAPLLDSASRLVFDYVFFHTPISPLPFSRLVDACSHELGFLGFFLNYSAHTIHPRTMIYRAAARAGNLEILSWAFTQNPNPDINQELLCIDAIVGGDRPEVMAWLVTHIYGDSICDHGHSIRNLCESIGRHGRVECFRWLFGCSSPDRRLAYTGDVLLAASCYGMVPFLASLHSDGFNVLRPWILERCVCPHQLPMLKWYVDTAIGGQRHDLYEPCYNAAAELGSLELIRLLDQHGGTLPVTTKNTHNLAMRAARGGLIEVLEVIFAQSAGPDWVGWEHCIHEAIMKNREQVLQFLESRIGPRLIPGLAGKQLNRAIKYRSNRVTFEWLRSKGCQWGLNTSYKLGRYASIDVVEYARGTGYRLDPRSFVDAVLRYLSDSTEIVAKLDLVDKLGYDFGPHYACAIVRHASNDRVIQWFLNHNSGWLLTRREIVNEMAEAEISLADLIGVLARARHPDIAYAFAVAAPRWKAW